MNHRKYLMRKLAVANSALANPTIVDSATRHAARCLINRTVTALHKLTPVTPMKRGLAVDKKKQPITPATSPRRRRKTETAAVIGMAAALAAPVRSV